MTQLDLLTGKPAAPTLKPLTERQQQVLELVETAGRDGVEPALVGAVLHELRGRHTSDMRCPFCSDDGKQALRALQKLKRVTRRKSGWWTLPNRKRAARG